MPWTPNKSAQSHPSLCLFNQESQETFRVWEEHKWCLVRLTTCPLNMYPWKRNALTIFHGDCRGDTVSTLRSPYRARLLFSSLSVCILKPRQWRSELCIKTSSVVALASFVVLQHQHPYPSSGPPLDSSLSPLSPWGLTLPFFLLHFTYSLRLLPALGLERKALSMETDGFREPHEVPGQ